MSVDQKLGLGFGLCRRPCFDQMGLPTLTRRTELNTQELVVSRRVLVLTVAVLLLSFPTNLLYNCFIQRLVLQRSCWGQGTFLKEPSSLYCPR